jgi:hypothetical protein
MQLGIGVKSATDRGCDFCIHRTGGHCRMCAQLDALKCRLLTQSGRRLRGGYCPSRDCCHAVALILGHHRGGRRREKHEKAGGHCERSLRAIG